MGTISSDQEAARDLRFKVDTKIGLINEKLDFCQEHKLSLTSYSNTRFVFSKEEDALLFRLSFA